jgi:energy-coupling factor transport system permease protein
MDNRFIISLVPGEGRISRLTGTTKVQLFAASLFLLMVSFDMRILLPGLILQCVLLCFLRPDLKRLRFILLFVVATNVINIVLFFLANPLIGATMVGKQTLLFSFSAHFPVTLETLFYFLARLMKIAGVFTASLWFVLSITPSQLAAGLYSLKVPYKVCTIVSLGLRYIPDILRDFENTKASMQMRGLELDPKKASLASRLKQITLILFPLIIVTFERVGVIASAMELRGYGQGKKRSYYCEAEPTREDFIYRALAALLFVIFLIYAVSGIIAPHPQLWYPF